VDLKNNNGSLVNFLFKKRLRIANKIQGNEVGTHVVSWYECANQFESFG